VIILMVALGLVKKVIEKIVLVKKFPSIVDLKLVRRFVFSNQRKHNVIIVVVIIVVVLHWRLVELSVKNRFLLHSHFRILLLMNKLLIAKPNNRRGKVVMDILQDRSVVSELWLLALTCCVVGCIGESETLPFEKLTLVRLGD